MSSSFFSLGTVLVVVLVCLRLVLAGTLKPSLAPLNPCCARCRYPTTGLNTLRCPECGSDLRATGIVTLAMAIRLMPGLASAILGWTAFSAIISYFIIFASYRSNVRYTNSDTSDAPALTLVPASGSCQRIELFQDYSFSDVFPVRLVLHSRNQTEHTLRMRHTGYGVNLADASGASTSIDGRVKADHLAVWYVDAGIDPKLPPHPAELDELSMLINAELSPEGDPWPAFNVFTSKTRPPSAVMQVGLGRVYTTAAVCASLYLAGTFLIVRRRRHLLGLADRMEQKAKNALTTLAESPPLSDPRTSTPTDSTA